MSEETVPSSSAPPPWRQLDLREENLNRTIIGLALPAIVANVLMFAVLWVDMFIVGRLNNAAALAATSFTTSVMWLVDAPVMALSIAAGSLVSRYWGARDYAAARRYAAQSIGFVLLWAVGGVLILSPMAPFALRWLGAKPDVVQLGVPFMRVIILSCVLGQSMMITTAAIRAIGDTVTPMILTVTMNLINVTASLSLAFGYGPWPAMGFMGVAWGTVIARSVGGVMAVAVLASSSRGIGLTVPDFLHLRKMVLLRVWHVAYPAMAERFLHSLANAGFMRIVAVLGTASVAANGVAGLVEGAAFMPAFGLGMAVATVAGQAIGAGKIHIAETAVKRGLHWSNVWMAVIGAMFVVLGPTLARFITETSDVVPLAGRAVQIAAIELIPLSFAIVLGSALRSAGDTRSPLWVTIVCLIFCRLGVTYLFAVVFKWGLVGVWLATAVDWTARAAGMWWVFRVGSWKSIHEKEKALYHH